MVRRRRPFQLIPPLVVKTRSNSLLPARFKERATVRILERFELDSRSYARELSRSSMSRLVSASLGMQGRGHRDDMSLNNEDLSGRREVIAERQVLLPI